jgi:hypothetical protein
MPGQVCVIPQGLVFLCAYVEQTFVVFGLAHDLGTISGASAPVVFSIGHVRDPVIRFRRPGMLIFMKTSGFP